MADDTGIPIGKIQAQEKDRLLGIETKLHERVKGQDKAIRTLSDAIIESRSGLSDPKKPIGSFFFLGPTGTGKTELTKSLADLLFDDDTAMIRFDMSEFKEEHSAALLYGAPPGYVGYEEGGLLVTKIRQKPYSVVLFDEIEKAHSSVYDIFLQIMDEGKVHDKLGREGDFSNSIIIFTSNIGSQWIAEQIQKGHQPTSNELIEVMSKYFRPEFLWSFDRGCTFLTYYRGGCSADFPSPILTPAEAVVGAEGYSVGFSTRDNSLPYLQRILATVWCASYCRCSENLSEKDYFQADCLRDYQAWRPHNSNL